MVTASLAMDDLIADTGVTYRAVTNPSFMDNLLRQAEAIKNDSTFRLPISGDLKQPSCATLHCGDGRAAAAGPLVTHRAAPRTGDPSPPARGKIGRAHV